MFTVVPGDFSSVEPTLPTCIENRKASYKAPVHNMGVLQRQTGFPGRSDFILHPEGRRVRGEARRVCQTEEILCGAPEAKK